MNIATRRPFIPMGPVAAEIGLPTKPHHPTCPAGAAFLERMSDDNIDETMANVYKSLKEPDIARVYLGRATKKLMIAHRAKQNIQTLKLA